MKAQPPLPVRTARPAAGRLIPLAVAALLAGCSPQPGATDRAPIPKAEADRAAAERFDVDRYVTNQFIPRPGAPPLPPLSPPRRLHVALQWLLTGDAAPWVVAQKKGFFRDLGLDVELEEGGPGRDMLSGLIMGRSDIYVGYPEVALSLITSRTGADVRMIGATLKSSGVGWIGLDPDVPRTERSTRRITAADLRGRRIGVQPGSDFLVAFMCDQLGLKPGEIRVMTEGATPDALVGGALDYYQGLRSDQPRLLERRGYFNWTFLPMAELGYTSYLDVSVVTAEFCAREPDVLYRYVAALDRSLRYIAGHSRETAEIMVAAIVNDPGSVEEMEDRVKRETRLCLGDGSEAPLFMSGSRVRNLVSILTRYHRIELGFNQ